MQTRWGIIALIGLILTFATVEFFNLILGTKLSAQEKQDLVAFLRAL